MSNRTQYENDLAALKTALTEMGQSAADAVEAAMEALCTADAEAAAAVAQGDGEAARSDDDLLAVGKLIVERAAHVKVSGLVRCCGTHGKPPESIFD